MYNVLQNTVTVKSLIFIFLITSRKILDFHIYKTYANWAYVYRTTIQSNEFRQVQVILYARISIKKHLYTNWLTSSSSQVSVEIRQNLLIRPVFIESILKDIY